MKNKQIDKEKNKKNKRRKKHTGRKILLIIILILTIAGGWFAYKTHKNGGGLSGMLATAVGHDEYTKKNLTEIKVLILGVSTDLDSELTDTIMVASYNPNTQKANLLSIPRDTFTGKYQSKALATQKINSIYNMTRNPEKTLNAVNELTGLDIKYYVLVRTEALIKLVDAIGGVTFDVPIDMDYDDPAQDLHIHLKAGEQLIDGEKAEQLLRFRHNNDGTSYPSEYGDNDIGRMRTQREFIQVTAKQLLRVENVTKVLNLMDIVFKNVKTNLDMETLKYYIPYIFKFNTSNIVSDTLPGTPEKCNGIWIYTADKTQTKQVIQDLFTDKIVEEEKNEESTSTNTTDGENTTKESKEITIELLNGTGDKEILTEVKEKLKEKGYVVSKSGTTSSTDKTTIINRTSQSNQKSKDIKQLLGVGTITSGSDNTKVDFTIIIGKDYK